MRTYRTHAFRSFRNELTRISRAYWHLDCALRISTKQVSSSATNLADSRPLPDVFAVPDNKLDVSPSAFVANFDVVSEDLRQMVLVKAFAIAESFLHTCAHYWAVARGFAGQKPNVLSKAGAALIKPAMVSNVHESAKYLAAVVPFVIDDIADTLRIGYLLRCAIAHNGGFWDDEHARKLAQLKPVPGQRIPLPWSSLHVYLKALDQLCERLELALPDRKLVETYWIAQDVLDERPSLNANKLRSALVNDYGFQALPSKRELAAKMGIQFV